MSTFLLIAGAALCVWTALAVAANYTSGREAE